MDPNRAGNRVLELMCAEAQTALGPLATVQLRARDVLYEPGMPALDVYFPLTAVVSVLATMEQGESAEVALIGREGMVGLAGVLGTLASATSVVVQISGIALRAQTSAVRAARAAHPDVRRALDAYTEASLMQMAQAAACNRLHSVQARLARSLLAVYRRIDGNGFVLSQECLAKGLGVHRPTVAVALQRLEEHGAISREGRRLIVSDAAMLEGLACECHRVLEREFERLLSNHGSRGSELVALTTAASMSREPDAAAALEAMREIAGRLLLTSIREQEAREEAQLARQTIESFLAMVSHELRTPLNAIIGWCAMLRMHEGADHRRGLQVIERNAHAQLRIVEDLLEAARVTAATLKIESSTVDFMELGHEAVDAVKPVADDKGVAVQLTIPDDLPPIVGDPDRLRQVLLNLLTNAIKFTDAGGSVDVSVTTVAGRLLVVIRDTGRGIPSSALPHVFERFHQGADTDARHHGLGLGLTIARALVELHGGHIEIASGGEHTGTTCTIDLPLVGGGGQAPRADARLGG